jgi:hypothetical protein
MKNIKELDPSDKNFIAIQNIIKIRNWIKKNIPAKMLDELDSNGANGQFTDNGYLYSWHASKVHGISLGVGCSRLVSFKDPHRSSGCGDYPLVDDEQYYYNYDAKHYGVFVDHWPSIKQVILSTFERVKARNAFEP